MICPCCERAMIDYERLVSRKTGGTTAVFWTCPRCAEECDDNDREDPACCSCEDEGNYYEMPPGAQLRAGGRHLL